MTGIPRYFTLAFWIAWLLNFAILLSRGQYETSAIYLLLVAFILCFWFFVFAIRGDSTHKAGPHSIAWWIWSGFFVLWSASLAMVQSLPFFQIWHMGWINLGMMLVLVSYLPGIIKKQPMAESRTLRLVRFTALALLVLAGGYYQIQALPRPPIDVWALQTAGAEALLRGENPYRVVRVPDTGNGPQAALVPYVYPPTQVYATVPAYVIFGDVRWAMLGAILATGALLRLIVAGAKQSLPAIVEDTPILFLWLSPALLFILEQAWIDPIQILLATTLVFFVLKKWPWMMAIALGLLLSAKQTMFWFLPLTTIFFHFNRRQWLLALGTFGSLLAPFLLWDFTALWFANIHYLAGLPTRLDALTFTNWLYYVFGIVVPHGTAFIPTGAIAVLALWRMPKHISGWSVTLLTMYFIFFAFNQQAFANYYFFLIGLAAILAAVALHEQTSS